MKCPNCQAETKISQTQTSGNNSHPLPVNFQDLKIIRRRRQCICNPEHKFWTIEMTEAFWSEVVERVKL